MVLAPERALERGKTSCSTGNCCMKQTKACLAVTLDDLAGEDPETGCRKFYRIKEEYGFPGLDSVGGPGVPPFNYGNPFDTNGPDCPNCATPTEVLFVS